LQGAESGMTIRWGNVGRQSDALAVAVVIALLTAALPTGCGTELPVDQSPVDAQPRAAEYEEPLNCGACHPTQYREWQGSIMHYAAMSPVFNAFELTIRKITEGAVAANGDQPNFCIQCHSPTGVYNGELPDFTDPENALPARDSLSRVSEQGLSCDVCHTVTGPNVEASLLGDGIANASLLFAPNATKFGPISDPSRTNYHGSSSSAFIQSPEFCGGCHDVRLPTPDADTGEPFQRLENLFTEWKEGPYSGVDNPYGRVIRCQDCHMSLYPLIEPGVFPWTLVGTGIDAVERRHAIHAFTAASIPFIDDPRFPNVDTEEKDRFGFPMGQRQRREQMLRAACTLTLEGTVTTVGPTDDKIRVSVVVTNVGAGHRVPSGFSQERQVWVELVVSDDAGAIYESGYLRDKAHPETGEITPDGLLDDEDLDDRHFTIDLATLDSHYEPGPDRDQRPEVNLGIVNFQNAFVRIGADGVREPVINPLLADTIENDHSLDMLVPTVKRYDIPRPERAIVGDIRVSARLRYRAFPPEFLRVLALREPSLVSEEIVDRNVIVDMAETSMTIRVIDEP